MFKTTFTKTLIAVIILGGIALAIYQFIYNRSLWNDEATVSLNIIHRSSLGLLKPLDYSQVAPILFLQLEHFNYFVISSSEYGLRLFPLLSFIASIFFLYATLAYIFKSYYTRIFAISLYVFNTTLLYYASEVKQYMTDVLVITLIYYLLIKNYKKQHTQLILLAVIGSVSIFLTNVAPVILLSAGVYLAFVNYGNKLIYGKLVSLALTWAITFCFYFIVFIANHPTKNYMLHYWANANAFMPLNPFKYDFYVFLITKCQMIFYFLFGYGVVIKIVIPILILLGYYTLYKKKLYPIIILLTLPGFVHLLLSGLKQYPFESRLILYLYPVFIISASFGFDYLIKLISAFSNPSILVRWRYIIITIPVYCLYWVYLNTFPITHTEIKNSLKYVASRIKKDERIYISGDLNPAFNFYKDTKFFVNNNDLVSGYYGLDQKIYIADAKKLKGKYWLLLSEEGTNGAKIILQQLNNMHYKQLDSFQFGNVTAKL
jgi:hypothetical protein